VISSNTAAKGGVVSAERISFGSFTDCVISDNAATERDGAGLFWNTWYVDSLAFIRCAIERNGQSAEDRHGLALRNARVAMTDCVVALYLNAHARVRLAIHDARGAVVRVLVDQPLRPGRHSVAWDEIGSSGTAVASGLYLARIEAGGATEIRRLVLVRWFPSTNAGLRLPERDGPRCKAAKPKE